MTLTSPLDRPRLADNGRPTFSPRRRLTVRATAMPLPPPLDRLRLPIIGAPLFIVSNPALVIAQCKAGIVGSFPALNARPQSQLDEWLHGVSEGLAGQDR